MPRGNEYRFAIGNVVVSLICHPPGLADFFENWFGVPSISKAADITFDFEIVPHDDLPYLPNTLLKTKTVLNDGSFNNSEGLIYGSVDPYTGQGSIMDK